MKEDVSLESTGCYATFKALGVTHLFEQFFGHGCLTLELKQLYNESAFWGIRLQSIWALSRIAARANCHPFGAFCEMWGIG